MTTREKQRKNRLWKLYRLTPKDFDKMMSYQGGVCAVSKKPPVNNRLNIDHRHIDGLIRGLLSLSINKGLAYFNDDPKLLRAAADYLENPPAIRALGKKVYGLIGQAKIKKVMKYGPK
jgi:hypothetical protein